MTATHAAYGKGETVNELGKYTILINPAAAGAAIPAGVGYGKMTVSKTGGVSVTGKLANGSAFSG